MQYKDDVKPANPAIFHHKTILSVQNKPTIDYYDIRPRIGHGPESDTCCMLPKSVGLRL